MHRRSQCSGVGHFGIDVALVFYTGGMATGTTRDDGSRRATRVSAADLPRGGGHPFHEWLNRILGAAGFDAFVDGPCARRVHRWPLEMACNAMLCTFVATVLSLAMERTLAPGYFVVGYSIGFCVQICNSVGRTCSPRRWRLASRVATTSCGLVAGLALGGALSAGRPLLLLADGPTLVITMLVGVMALAGFEVLTHSWDTRDRLLRAERDALAADKALAESRLRVLQAQVEPHFLFNTLANVISLIRTKPVRAIGLLDALTSLLRASLSRTRHIDGTLADEIEVVRKYLEVQALRMDGRLTYEVRVDPGLGMVRAPPFLLQPLVENAVLHGIEPSAAGGRVEVRATRLAGAMLVRVTDDGVGLNPDTAARGGGIVNVRERLQATFGPRGQLFITDAPGGGVSVNLRIPLTFVVDSPWWNSRAIPRPNGAGEQKSPLGKT